MGSVYILPSQPDCLEGFGWLAQEVRQANGEALVMRVKRFEGVPDAELVGRFNAARRAEYEELEASLSDLVAEVPDEATAEARLSALERLKKLRKRHAEILRRDFFGSPEGVMVAIKLAQLGRKLTGDVQEVVVARVNAEDFRGRVWVTRPQPHVDRLASVWLVRRFIDPGVVVRYDHEAREGEVSFDMAGAEFGHTGNLCTFETLLAAFGLENLALRAVAEIVHELDLQDGRYARPEVAGLDAVLEGWRQLPLSDEALEAHGTALFEGLYTSLAASQPTDTAAPGQTHIKEHHS